MDTQPLAYNIAEAFKHPTLNKLTPRQKIFVLKLIETGGNATEAMIRMGKSKSRKGASVTGSEILAKPIVREAVDILLSKVGLTQDAIASKWVDATKVGWGEKAKHSDAIRALEVVTKMAGMLHEQQKKTQKSVHRKVAGEDTVWTEVITG
jgi:phage terminase small subunit